MDAKGGFTRIRAKTPRTIALIACLGAAFTIGACGDNSGGPVTPKLLGVLDGGCAEIPPGTPGGFAVLPHEDVRLRVAAAWPSADLVVKANNTELEKVGPSDTGRQQTLRTNDTGFWVPENIDPNPTPPAWTVDVDLPSSMRAGPLTLELTSRKPDGAASSPLTVTAINDMTAAAPAFNRVTLTWRDRGDELGYLLERSVGGGPYTGLVSIGTGATGYTDTSVRGNRLYSYRLTAQGCGAPGGPRNGFSTSTAAVTTPKQTGTETISLSVDPNANPIGFVYKNPLNIFLPEDALVTSVKNVARDVNDDEAVPMELVTHTDAAGTKSLPAASCPAVPLAPGASTSVFNGQTVQGAWSVTAACISKQLLRDHLELEIKWSQ